MSKYPEMTRPPHQGPILTGDCRLDIERGNAWLAPEAVEARAELMLRWEEELRERAVEAEQERQAQDRLAQEQLAAEWAQEIEHATVAAPA